MPATRPDKSATRSERGAPDRRLRLLLTQEYQDTSVEYVEMHPEHFQGCFDYVYILKNIKLATVT
jgi:hypothetical protein